EQDNVYQQLLGNAGANSVNNGADAAGKRDSLWSPTTTAGPWAYCYGPPVSSDGNTDAFQVPQVPVDTIIKSYLCPSDNMGAGNNTLTSGGSGTASDGSTINPSPAGIVDAMGVTAHDPANGNHVYIDYVYDTPGFGRELGRSNYVGVGGAYNKVDPSDAAHSQWLPYTGIFNSYNSKQPTKMADIKDGTSNTIMFGEYLGGVHKDGSRNLELTWMGSGGWPTLYGLAPNLNYVYNSGQVANRTEYSWRQFQSAHPGLVNF